MGERLDLAARDLEYRDRSDEWVSFDHDRHLLVERGESLLGGPEHCGQTHRLGDRRADLAHRRRHRLGVSLHERSFMAIDGPIDDPTGDHRDDQSGGENG